MADIKLLNNLDHQNLRVKTEFSPELGDNVTSTLTFITEFAEVQKDYPILFRKDPESGDYQSVVLFGFIKAENLFLTAQNSAEQIYPGWGANYVPAALARGPFSIGLQKSMENGEEKVTPMIQIDVEHPKVNTEQGVAVFSSQGGNSPYLEQVINLLNIIGDGMRLNKAMFEAFEKYELMEEVTIEIDLENQDKHRINGFKTIHAEKLNALPGEALAELSQSGFLQAAYFAIASLSNIKKLIAKKNLKNRRAS